MIFLNNNFDEFCKSHSHCNDCEFESCESAEDCRTRYLREQQYQDNFNKIEKIEEKLDVIIMLLKEKM